MWAIAQAAQCTSRQKAAPEHRITYDEPNIPTLTALTTVASIACSSSVSIPVAATAPAVALTQAPIGISIPTPTATPNPTAVPTATPLPLFIATAEPYLGPPQQSAPDPDLLAPALSLEEREKLSIFRDPNLGSSWRTDFTKRTISLTEFVRILPRDGIAPLDAPDFFIVSEAPEYARAREPVISLEISDEARAYPLAIMMQHEIVNDLVGGAPITVTFSPLCNTAIAFDRRVADQELTFGTSGTVRNSDLVVWDRQTETWWEQIPGEAVVGELTGYRLHFILAAIVAWESFATQHPDRLVVERPGNPSTYDVSPYDGYDDVDTPPLLFEGETDGRLPATARVLTIESDDESVAYPFDLLQSELVLNDSVGSLKIVAMFDTDVFSGFQAGSSERVAGATTVFNRNIGDQPLTFESEGGQFIDQQTGFTWNNSGQAVDGPLAGQRLSPVLHANHFWFAWAVFKPETVIRDDVGDLTPG
jgi:hypothetical protein